MSEEHKEKSFEMPMVPFFGLDMARELGSVDARLKQLEAGQARLEAKIEAVDARLSAKIDAVDARLSDKIDAIDAKLSAKIDAIDAKFEAKTDKMANALNRLDERTKNLSMVTWGGIVVLLIAIIAQKLL